MTPAERLARAVLLDYEEIELSDEEFSEQLKTLLGDDTREAICEMARATLTWLHVPI